MRILKIRILNLNSLSLRTEIDFTRPPISDTGLFAITGDTGSGKTTILDAMTLALYGKIHRNKDVKEVLSYGTTECFAEVEFEVPQGVYLAKWSLWRARGKRDGAIQSPTHILAHLDVKTGDFVTAVDKKSEVPKKIEALTGLDYARFTRSVLLAQGDFAAFLNASDKERSDLLERITGTEIYSRISMAAYQRYKEENDRLAQLQVQQDALQLLSKDEKKALKTKQKETETAIATQKTAYTQLQAQVQSQENIEKLSQSLEKLTTAQTDLQKRRQASETTIHQLERHEQTLPFQAQLFALKNTQKEHTAILAETEQSEKAIVLLEKAATDSQKTLQQKQAAQATQHKEVAALEKLLKQVEKLDLTIEQTGLPVARLETKQLEVSQEIASLKTRLSELETKQQAAEKQRAELQGWLKKHKKLAHFHALIPEIRLQREQLRDIFKHQKQTEKETAATHKKQKQYAEKRKKLDKKRQEVQARVSELQQSFKRTAPENYVRSREELITQLGSEIEMLNNENKNLQQLKSLSQEYMRLLQKQTEWQDTLQHLQQQEVMLGKKILTLTELLEEVNELITYKQAVLEQQQLIANYARDREQLAEGKPCPLCFSTTHPFRDHDLKPYIDKAQAEYDVVQVQQKTLHEEYLATMGHYRDLIRQIQYLQGDAVLQLEGQLDLNLEQMLQLETKIAAFVPGLHTDHYAIVKEAVLAQKIADFEHTLQSKKAAREQLLLINKTLATHEEQQRKLIDETKEMDFERRQLDEQAQRLQHRTDELRTRFENASKLINKHLKKLGYAFGDAQEAGAMFEQLETDGRLFAEKQQTVQQLEKDLALFTQNIENQKDKINVQQQNLKVLDTELQQAKDRLDKLQAERYELFEDKNTEIVRNTASQKLLDATQQTEQAQQAAEQATLRLNSRKAALEEQQRQAEKLARQRKDLQENLTKALENAPFSDMDDLQKAVLDEAQADMFRSLRKQLEQEQIELNQALKTTRVALAEAQEKTPEPIDLSDARLQLQTLDTQLGVLQQQLGSIGEQLKQDTQRRRQATQLLRQIEIQQAELARWSKLNDLIGQADGQKFRKYAQGLTLQNLLAYANRHLQQLHGRYQIAKPPDQDLQLEIIDAFQADNRRSLQTLSGGEQFLISLALALALSDMAGQRTNIQSLFIDEGFGTLDEQTLDMAISTLENLQAQGKTIGIISHVKELKERIGTQVRVLKSGSGRSTVEVVG